jgi:hypothetical protein
MQKEEEHKFNLPLKGNPQDVFHTPEGYFERFPSMMSDRIHAQNYKTENIWFKSTFFKYASFASFAFILIGLFVLNPFNNTSEQNSESTLLLGELHDEEIFDMYAEYMLINDTTMQYNDEEKAIVAEYLLENTLDPYELIIE